MTTNPATLTTGPVIFEANGTATPMTSRVRPTSTPPTRTAGCALRRRDLLRDDLRWVRDSLWKCCVNVGSSWASDFSSSARRLRSSADSATSNLLGDGLDPLMPIPALTRWGRALAQCSKCSSVFHVMEPLVPRRGSLATCAHAQGLSWHTHARTNSMAERPDTASHRPLPRTSDTMRRIHGCRTVAVHPVGGAAREARCQLHQFRWLANARALHIRPRRAPSSAHQRGTLRPVAHGRGPGCRSAGW